MEFNSQICTTKEQSERLLALGLKKETADMCWNTVTLHGVPVTYPSQESWLDYSIISDNHIPAWSLHRLMEIGNFVHIALLDVNKAYKSCIDNIEEKIRFGFINKEYLVEKQ